MFLLLACAGAPEAPRPNVLWISLDTVSAEHLALYGGDAKLPALESLGGRIYGRAYAHFPETAVSHWTMMSGVLPEVHGDVPRYGASAYTGPALAEVLGGAGYDTAAFIGGLTLKNNASGLGRGFDRYDDAFSGETRPSADVAEEASTWIGHQTGPWFAFVHFFDAHFPYEPRDPRRYDPDYTGGYDGTDATLSAHRDHGTALGERDLRHVEALYHAEISELDGALANVLATADDATIVVVTADHGESFRHGYYFNHRASLYDEVLHVPLVIRAPNLLVGRDDRLAGLADVMPTVLDLAGIAIPAGVQGRTLRGPDVRTTVGSRTDPFMPPSWFALRSATHKVIWPVSPAGTPRGFDLAADPDEERPTAPDATLIAARDAYDAAIAGMAPWIETPKDTRQILSDEGAKLEALGYVVPGGGPPPPPPGSGAPQPPGAPGPMGPPPGTPGGPQGPPNPAPYVPPTTGPR
jgi:arylsulfatase